MYGAAAHLTTLLFVLQGRVTALHERRDRGATAVEYGLLVGLIAIAIIVAVTAFGTSLAGLFTNIKSKLPTVG